MGRKKPKDSETLIQSNPNESPSNVFKTLFGDIAIDNSVVSLFSDTNPFKRKHNELGVSVPSTENRNGIDSEAIEKKKKRRKVEEDEVVEEEEEAEEARTPQKKEKRKNPNPDPDNDNSVKKEGKKKVKGRDFDVGSDSNAVMRFDGEGNPNLDENEEREKKEQNGDMSKKEKEKKKKKRKRDELEKDYEVKKYGAIGEEEEEEEREDKGGEGSNKGVGKKRKKVENPAETMVSKEGFDDESKLLRTVFVGNLPLKFKKKALVKEFSKFGEVESVRIRSVPIIDVCRKVVAFLILC